MIYLHVPFCRSFCIYCDFYSEIPGCSARAGESGISRLSGTGRTAREGACFAGAGRGLGGERSAGSIAGAGRSAEEMEFWRFAEAVEGEIRERIGGAGGFRKMYWASPNTLYIGGGTPSVLPVRVIQKMVGALGDCELSLDFQEFTVEVNPDDIVSGGREYVEGLLGVGVNRVSMGVQSFDDRILRWMRRRHDAATAVRAYGILREAGVRNVSIDLMFGMAALSEEVWGETLERALNLPGGPPEHVSAYQLSIEPGSVLGEMERRAAGLAGVAGAAAAESAGAVELGSTWVPGALASEAMCERQYEMLCERLRAAGYEHYEISNFAKPGRRALHNSAYWSGASYIGLGPGAHSYDATRFIRSWNCESLKDYIAAFTAPSSTASFASADFAAHSCATSSAASSSGASTGLSAGAGPASGADSIAGESPCIFVGREAISDCEILTEEQRRIEKVMLALRTADGINATELESIIGPAKLKSLLRTGHLEYTTAPATLQAPSSASSSATPSASPSATSQHLTNIRIPESHFFISDSIIASCLPD